MTNTWRQVSFLLIACILTACGGQQVKEGHNSDDSASHYSYLIELVSIDRFEEYAIAEFQVKKRGLEAEVKQSAVWQPVANRAVELSHVGSYLRVINEKGSQISTDNNGTFRLKVALADPLQFFRWVKPSSYPISQEYVAKFGDVERTIPYKQRGPWKGWEQSEVDENYLIKLSVDDATYWLPISYKDIRPLLKKLSEDVHKNELSHLELELEKENRQDLDGVDVFISGQKTDARPLLSKYVFSDDALNYSLRVFPSYVQGQEGGYDKINFSLIPGDYMLQIQRNGEIIFEDLIAVHESGEHKVTIVVVDPCC